MLAVGLCAAMVDALTGCGRFGNDRQYKCGGKNGFGTE